MSRWKAAAIHLSISAAIGLLVSGWIYFVWYPQPYFFVSGGALLTLLIVGVDVVVGPMLTLLVFDTQKKSLRFDLSVIALLQFSALVYGVYVISEARPAFIVARIDRLLIVPANQLEDSDLAEAKQVEFRTRSWTGPLLVGAPIPAGDEKLSAFFAGLAGRDLERTPKYYVPYAEFAPLLMTYAKPVAELRAKSEKAALMTDRWINAHSASAESLVWMPLQFRDRHYTVLLAMDSKRPVGVIEFDPW